MRLRRVLANAVAAAVLAAVGLPAYAAEAKRPLVLLFEANRGDGADRQLAESTTKAIRTYLRDTERVQVALFNRESPTVVRAIMDKKLTEDKLTSFSSQTERTDVARVLSFQYSAGAEVSVLENEGARRVDVKLWLALVDGGKNGKWESSGSAVASGAGPMALDNAMQSAASSAALDIARRALAELPRISEPTPTTGNETTAITTTRPGLPNGLVASDYAAQGDDSLKSGNLALAIHQYSQAVNADPTNGALRVKLAGAYARRAMYADAAGELAQAEKLGADAAAVSSTRALLEELQNGKKASPPPTAAPPAQDVAPTRVVVKPGNSSVAKIVEGDKLWAAQKPDEAALAYQESIKLDPSDWRAHERLAVVDASMSLFGEARKVLEQLATVQPSPSAQVVSNRYDMLRKAFDTQFGALLKQYATDAADFDKHIITRESYYSTVKGLALRLESMAAFLDAMPIPPVKQPAHLRRSIACGLAAQAASSLLDYLESNNAKSKSNAAVFAAQAKSDIETAQTLEANQVVVTRDVVPEPAPAPAPEQPVDASAGSEPSSP